MGSIKGSAGGEHGGECAESKRMKGVRDGARCRGTPGDDDQIAGRARGQRPRPNSAAKVSEDGGERFLSTMSIRPTVVANNEKAVDHDLTEDWSADCCGGM